jgi:hypothetical protein
MIDFLSLDTEGSEWDILEAIDFSRYKFGLMAIEHNYTENKRQKIYTKLKSLGYNRFDAEFDDLYYHPLHMERLNGSVRVDFENILKDYADRYGFGKEPI